MKKFNFNIDINNDDSNCNFSKSIHKNQSQLELYTKLTYVDLDLPDRILWARYNVGVDINNLETCKDWQGDLYAWGELKSKDIYDWNSYEHNLNKGKGNSLKLIKVQKYNELEKLPLEDDVAYFNNSEQCMPTKYQLTSLFNNTQCSTVINYSGIKGLNGIILKSLKKSNEDHLFFPFIKFDNIPDAKDELYLWSSNKDEYSTNRAYGYAIPYYLINYSIIGKITSYEMRHGFSVRGVKII